MAKKKAKKKTSRRKPAKKTASRSVPVKPAQDVKAKAGEILESRNAELFRMLMESSEIIRAASFTEVQIQIQKDMTKSLEIAKKELISELVAIKKNSAEHKSKVDSLTRERNKIQTENHSLQKKTSSLSRETDKLADKQEKLSKDVANLEKRAKALREDVERLTQIRKDYMERIAKFRGMREDLIS